MSMQKILFASAACAMFAACSTDGRMSFAGGGESKPPPSGGSGAPPDEPPSAAPGTLARTLDGAQQVLASAGNVGDLLRQSGVVDETFTLVDQTGLAPALDGVIDPLARVSVGEGALIGAGGDSRQALGVSLLSSDQNAGDVATIGVLANGAIASFAVNPEAESANVLGVVVQDQTVVGGDNPVIALGAVSGAQAQGDLLGVDVLNGDQILGVSAGDGAEGAGALLEGVTGALAGALTPGN